MPFIAKPSPGAPREVEVPLEKFPAILRAIANSDARDFVEWLLLTGTRPKGVGRLRWEWLDTSDRETWTLSVPSEKGGNAREYAIDGSLRVVIERRQAARRLGCPFIFHGGGRSLDYGARAARWVRAHFYRALEVCELPRGKAAGFCLYDTKKTAIGALFDAGLTEAEVQHFSGHKTSPMVQRYHVKNADRHRAAIRKRDEYFEKRGADSRGGRRRQ